MRKLFYLLSILCFSQQSLANDINDKTPTVTTFYHPRSAKQKKQSKLNPTILKQLDPYWFLQTNTVDYLPLAGGTLSSSADQILTINKTSGSHWNYIGFSYNGTRKAYFGLNDEGNPIWGSDSGPLTLASHLNGASANFNGFISANQFIVSQNEQAYRFNTNSSWGPWARALVSVNDGSNNILGQFGTYGAAGTQVDMFWFGQNWDNRTLDLFPSPKQLNLYGNLLVQGSQGFNATDETATISIGDGASYIRAIYDRGLTFGQNNVERMRIQGVTGYVGIATSTPSEPLHVVGTTTSVLRLHKTTGGGNGTLLMSTDFGGGNSFSLSPYIHGVSNGGFSIRDVTNNTDRIVIQANTGNVGIGTTNPGAYKLAVEGTIGARKLKVTQGTWADDVFKKNYKLRPISEVEKYIQQHGHLPEVPSEKEVKGKDLDISETQTMVLKKIEELTLYVIELKKENQQQNKKIKKLERKK